jgi:predicted component of type VI protein secretion system
MILKFRILQGKFLDQQGRSAGREIVVRSNRFLIGSAPNCHLRCDSRLIGRYHCAVDLEADRVVLHDGGSESGTYLNGKRLDASACLFHGDRVQVGRLVFEVVLSAEPQAQRAAS